MVIGEKRQEKGAYTCKILCLRDRLCFIVLLFYWLKAYDNIQECPTMVAVAAATRLK
jgi:hypothetical protein